MRLSYLPVLFFAATLSAQESLDLERGIEEWYLPTRDGNCRLYIREFGTGSPVVVLHGGFGAEHGYLVDAVAGLEHARTFVFYDQRGSLRSPCPVQRVTLSNQVDDLDLLRQSLGVERLALFAHSAGTLVAMAYLERHPERVERMVLAAMVRPKAELVAADFPSGELPPGFDEQAGKLAAFRQRPELRAELERWRVVGGKLSAREQSRQWRISFGAANLFHADRWQQMKGGQVFYSAAVGKAMSASMPEPLDYLGVLRQARCPIAVIGGDHDFTDFGAVVFPALFAGCEHIAVHTLPRCGHNSWIDQPDGFRGALAAGLAIAAPAAK